MKQIGFAIIVVLLVAVSVFGGRFTSESFVDIPAVSAQEGFVEIPTTSGAPAIALYPDTAVGRWIIKVPMPEGEVFIQTTPLVCPPSKSRALQIGNYRITGPAILNGWTNAPGQDQSEWKTRINAGETFTLVRVGGTLWPFADSCSEKELRDNFDQNRLPAQSWAQLNARGLAR